FHRVGVRARLRNWAGNVIFQWMLSGILRTINRQRRAWGLPAVRGLNDTFSALAQVTQLPAALELPGRRLPPGLHHTGPSTDAAGRELVDFPWSRLDSGRPLVYASMGTLQNGILRTFRMIAEACAGLDVQLVISLGGGQDPALVGDLPGDPVVVGYAPQLDLIRRSTLTISHGGLNTALESLAQGVPMVVLPVTYDQPGVGARVEWAGVGRTIPVGRVTVGRLRDAVRAVLGDPAYRARARGLRSKIEADDGLNRAADLIGAAVGGPRPAAGGGGGAGGWGGAGRWGGGGEEGGGGGVFATPRGGPAPPPIGGPLSLIRRYVMSGWNSHTRFAGTTLTILLIAGAAAAVVLFAGQPRFPAP